MTRTGRRYPVQPAARGGLPLSTCRRVHSSGTNLRKDRGDRLGARVDHVKAAEMARKASRVERGWILCLAMSKVHFVGGEKGGVGKSVVARLLCQYCIDKKLPFAAV